MTKAWELSVHSLFLLAKIVQELLEEYPVINFRGGQHEES